MDIHPAIRQNLYLAPVLLSLMVCVGLSVWAWRRRAPMGAHAFAIAIHNLTDAVIVLDDENRIVDLNPAAQTLLGSDRPALAGTTLEQALPQWAQIVDRVQSLAEARQDVLVETRAGARWVDVRISPIPAAGGRRGGQVVSLRDLSRRKQLEAERDQAREALEARVRAGTAELAAANTALRESQERFARVIEAVPHGLVIVDSAEQVIQANPAVQGILGLDRGHLVGRRFSDLLRNHTTFDGRPLAEGDLPLARVLRDQAAALGLELLLHHPPGKAVILSLHAVPIPGTAGQLEGALAVLIDITERHQMLAALHKSEERHRALVANSAEGIYLYELEQPLVTTWPEDEQIEHLYRHVYVAEANDACARILGLTQGNELIGRRFGDILDRADPQNDHILRNFVRSGYRVFDSERYWQIPSGQLIYTAASYFGSFEGGCLVRIWGVLRDITERHRSEAALRLMNAGLELRVEARTRELSALYDISGIAGQPLSVPVMLERSLARLGETAECRAAAVFLREGESDVPQLAVEWGANSQTLGAAVGGRPEWLKRLLQGGSISPLSLQLEDGLTEVRAVGLPLRARSRSLGALVFFGKDWAAFSPEEQALLAAAADQMGLMVENARLQREATQAAIIEERQRLARELHDSVTQLLYGLTLHAQAARQAVEAENVERAHFYLTQVGDAARQALREMRLLIHELRPTIFTSAGLIGALRQRLDAVEGRSGVRVQLSADALPSLPPAVEESLYWIAQEALNNALKHSRSPTVEVRLWGQADQVHLQVTDFGSGFDREAIADGGGLGLISMRERAKNVGGRLTLTSAVGHGTTVTCDMPVPSAAARPDTRSVAR